MGGVGFLVFAFVFVFEEPLSQCDERKKILRLQSIKCFKVLEADRTMHNFSHFSK